MSIIISHKDDVKLTKQADVYVLEIGNLKLQVHPTDNGVSFISNHPLKEISPFDRPMGGFYEGFEGASLVLLEKQ